MEGLAEAIEKIEQLALESAKTQILTVPQERSGVYFLVGPDGKAERKLSDPSWRGEKLATPEQLVKYVVEHKDEKSGVFFEENAIVFLYDATDRRDLAACPLRVSPQYAWLKSPAAAMTQPDFVRLLRITFRGCLATDGNLLALVRSIKWNVNADGASEVQHGKESINKSIVAQVNGTSAMPDEITLTLPVFENFAFKTRVACAVELFPHEQTFKLTPYPLEVKAAMDATMAEIGKLFTAADLPPAYRGQP